MKYEIDIQQIFNDEIYSINKIDTNLSIRAFFICKKNTIYIVINKILPKFYRLNKYWTKTKWGQNLYGKIKNTISNNKSNNNKNINILKNEINDNIHYDESERKIMIDKILLYHYYNYLLKNIQINIYDIYNKINKNQFNYFYDYLKDRFNEIHINKYKYYYKNFFDINIL